MLQLQRQATAGIRQHHARELAIWRTRPRPVPYRSIGTASPAHAARTQEMCVIVDEKNNIIDAQPRDITVRNRLLGRGSYVLVFNTQQELFVSKRSDSKDVYPGHLDVVVSGVVAVGESYRDTASRELEEEIGAPRQLADAQLQQLFIFPYQDEVCHVWGAAFSFTWDGPVSFPDKEVDWGRFMALEELQQLQQQAGVKFTSVGGRILDLYFQHHMQLRQQGQKL